MVSGLFKPDREREWETYSTPLRRSTRYIVDMFKSKITKTVRNIYQEKVQLWTHLSYLNQSLRNRLDTVNFSILEQTRDLRHIAVYQRESGAHR